MSPEFNLFSWTLSCLQLKKFYPKVTLYADDLSAKLLIDVLKLPYDNVVCELNRLDKYHPQLWALPKIYSYSKQQSPFLHVDGDVFIYERFNSELLKNDLIAQNQEAATEYYESNLQSLESHLMYFPVEIQVERKQKRPLHAYNAGIFGGTDIDFFHEYTSEAFRFVERNESRLSNINVSNFNIFFEQYLFYCFVRKKDKKVAVLFDKVFGDNEYVGFGDFVDVPYLRKYIHLLGSYKRNERICNQMANRLRLDYPEYFYRIVAHFKRKNTLLLNDFYWFESNELEPLEEELMRNHFMVSGNYLEAAASYVPKENYGVGRVSITRKENIFYRVQLLEKIVEALALEKSFLVPQKILDCHIKNIIAFEEYLEKAVNKFARIPHSYLLGRDINSTGYFQNIFGCSDEIFTKVLICDKIVEVTQAALDLTLLDTSVILDEYLKFFESNSALFNILIVPECNQKGYSLSVIDSLDLAILENLSDCLTISSLLCQMESYFDPSDLSESRLEFESLIFGRIKKGIENKSIKLLE